MLSDKPGRIIVPAELHGLRIDAALASLLPNFSRSKLSAWLKEGLFLVDGKTAKPKDKVQVGAEIHLPEEMPLTEQPELVDAKAQNISLDILFEDEETIIINKPAGLVVHPGAGNYDNTLVNGLLYHNEALRSVPRAGIVHRLDKDTTGLMVVAKTIQSHYHLVQQLQARTVRREYLGLAWGEVYDEERIETGFGRNPKNRLKMAVLKQGKEAITDIIPIEHLPGATLCRFKLHTGRTHQIRVHADHIDHPLVGDPLYGNPLVQQRQLRGHPALSFLKSFPRQALHATTLSFEHPTLHKQMLFKAALPDDFEQLLISLRECEEQDDDY